MCSVISVVEIRGRPYSPSERNAGLAVLLQGAEQGLVESRHSKTETSGRGITLGEADKQVGQYEGAGDNSYRRSIVKALAGLAAYPWALCRMTTTSRGVLSAMSRLCHYQRTTFNHSYPINQCLGWSHANRTPDSNIERL